MVHKIRWRKIIANSFFQFFITLNAVISIDSLAKLNAPLETLIFPAIVVALINGGLAFTQEWAKEEEEPNGKRKN